MTDNNKRPIIIKKIKKHGHGHHGGAWKVAYADFVTAMMAFFLLLWLLNSVTAEALQGISEYFTPTIGVAGEKGIGFKGGISSQEEKGVNREVTSGGGEGIIFGTEKTGPIIKLPEESEVEDEEEEAQKFTSIQKQLENFIKNSEDLGKFNENVEIEQTPEGLRIRIMDTDDSSMFNAGSSQLKDYTKKILSKVADLVRYIPNYLSIEGNTTKNIITTQVNYTNWELSMERANETRKFLFEQKIPPEQVYRIVGKADSDPIENMHPNSTKNRRIELILLRNNIIPYHKRSAPDNLDKFKKQAVEDVKGFDQEEVNSEELSPLLKDNKSVGPTS